MATQYSQLDQRGRSITNHETGNRRMRRLRERVQARVFMDRAVQAVRNSTEEMIGCHPDILIIDDPVRPRVETVEVHFQRLSFAQAKVELKDLPLSGIKSIKYAEAMIADAASAPEPDKAFCVEMEVNGGWERVPECGTSDRARDLENDAVRTAKSNRERKIRVIRCEGGRAVLRFRVNQRGILGSY